MSFDRCGKANLGSILGRVEVLRQTCDHKVCVRIVERNRLPVTRNLLFPSIRVAATPPAKTRLAVTSRTLINKRRLLIRQGSYEAEEVGPLETRRSLNVAYFFSPFLQATRLRTTGRRHALKRVLYAFRNTDYSGD